MEKEPTQVEPTKVCPQCKKEKPYSKFGYRSDRPAQPRGLCRACYAHNHRVKYKDDPEYQERQKQWARNSYYRLKQEVIAAYGGECVCCGETEPRFLTIDHINGNGASSRRSGEGLGSALYGNLKRRGFPKDNYQLLCFNCNCAKRQFGMCPHNETPRHINAVQAA